MPDFSCDLSAAFEPFEHVWEHTVGSDHAPIGLRADWQRQLRACRAALGFRHMRCHGLLSDDMGTLICHKNELLYSFFNIDQLFDFLLSIGMRPFVELSFMPLVLASGSETVFRYRGNITPPKDFGEWALLIGKLLRHWRDRYGVDEIRRWYFEVWNEPNLHDFWTGTQEQYFTLYRHTVEAIKAVDPSLRVGGPATAQNEWLPAFIDYCGRHGLAADFISTHYYPTDAFGKIGADTLTQLANAPRDVMADRAREARAAVGDRPLFYTEWNVSSNPRDVLHDQPFAAAYAARILMGAAPLVQAYSFWTFTDIFAENYFPSVPFHGGFGLLNLNGIPKPVYRAFEMLHRLGTRQHTVEGTHQTVGAWATSDQHDLTMLMINHAQPRQPINTEVVKIVVKNGGQPRTALIERIDDRHANVYRAWQDMGSPESLSASDVSYLRTVSQTTKEPIALQCDEGAVRFDVDLPPHSIAAVSIEGACRD